MRPCSVQYLVDQAVQCGVSRRGVCCLGGVLMPSHDPGLSTEGAFMRSEALTPVKSVDSTASRMHVRLFRLLLLAERFTLKSAGVSDQSLQ